MTKNIREVLSPLLIISYVCGLRVIELPANKPKQWFSFLYVLLLWSLYNFSLVQEISYTFNYSIEYHVCFGIEISSVLISFVISVYYNKIFGNCIKKLIILDDTLKNLGITTNYHKFKIRIVWSTLAWSIIVILMTYLESYVLNKYFDILPAIIIPVVRNYYSYINFIGDLIIVIILGYTGLKFDQINECLKKLSEDNKDKDKIQIISEYSILYSNKSRFSKALKNKCVTWIVMHLHSELCKISREIDSIFGIQMTIQIGCYFAFIAMYCKEIFRLIFIKNDIANNIIMYVILIVFWFFVYVFRLLLINYVCEKVSTKANATGDFINRLTYSICETEIHENVLQFLLHITQSPLRFYGLGFFQFGFKFICGFSASILTILIIYLQTYTSIKR